MEFDLLYIILPVTAAVLFFFLGRFSKKVKEETYENMFSRLRTKNDILKGKLKLVEAELQSYGNKTVQFFPLQTADTNPKSLTAHKLNWKIKQNTILKDKSIKSL